MATPRELEEESAVYLVVSGIPAGVRSAQLRSYFSQFREQRGGGFLCFHYRHRPERGPAPAAARTTAPDDARASAPLPTGSCCCVVSVRGAAQARRLLRMYSGRRWLDSQGTWLPGRCVIRRLRLPTEASGEGSGRDCRLGADALSRGVGTGQACLPPFGVLSQFRTGLHMSSLSLLLGVTRGLKRQKPKQRPG